MKIIRNTVLGLALSLVIGLSYTASAHCEIPCGIYDDSVRVKLMYEHISTIEKSIKMINELEAAADINYNQLVRWVVNKEEHAKKLQDIVEQYFMHQRIKPVDETEKEKYEDYIAQLTLAHQLTVYAMKAKQNADLVYVKKMRETVHLFEHAYFGDH